MRKNPIIPASPFRVIFLSLLLLGSSAVYAASPVTQYEYDPNGNRTKITDGLSHATISAYDALNRVSGITDAANGQIGLVHNALDQLTQVTDPNGFVTVYVNDGLGNLKQQISPDTGTTTNTYDAAGNLLTKTDAKGQTTTYTYDSLNRVTSITYHDTSQVTYQYDQGTNGIGRLSSITDSLGSITYAYDSHGRVISETRTLGSGTYLTSYSYNSAGLLNGITYPSGRSLSYTLDSLGRIQQISTTKDNVTQVLVTDIQYRPFGPAQEFEFGNGAVYTRQFDLDGRITSYTLGAQVMALSYDDASRITSLSEVGVPANTRSYGYDAIDRLTQYTAPNENQSHAYDANGNRTSITVGANTYTYSYPSTSNRLTSTQGPAPNKSYTYDANGSPTTDGSNQYTYDVRGRLTQAVTSIGTYNYAINALGQRIRKSTSTTGVVYHYDLHGHLIAEKDLQSNQTKEYVYLNDMPVAVINDVSTPYNIYTDQLNTPRAITNQSNNLVWTWDSDSFGSTIANGDPNNTGTTFTFNLRFPGQYFDEETRLHYNYFRDYEPHTGRYIESDPIGLEGGINTYAYAEGNPLSYTDPTGEFVPQLVGFGIGAGLEYLTNPCANAGDILMAGAIGAFGGAVSKAVFLRFGPRSLTNVTGKEWSHSIPRRTVNRHLSGSLNRMMNRRGGPNGSWRSPQSHAAHDPSRHVPGVDPLPLPIRVVDRIPDWLKGAGIAGGLGAKVAGGNCECN